MKKRIGISYTRTNFQYYWDWFTPDDLRDDLELVLLSFEKNNQVDIATCDGFVLTGGVDIDPAVYGGETGYENQPETFEPERDRFEALIYQYSQEHRLPLLGICRGLQLVNVLEGGKLIQDQGEANQQHMKIGDIDNLHHVQVERDSLLFEIAGIPAREVNSAHHQVIDENKLGRNLRVNARSGAGDNTIEGIEFANKSGRAFMLCVQWHPERMPDQENELAKNIKNRFLAEIRK
ncbi:gamma-glutamyl-gamma-aminobutyrate hydrolase family protein [Flavihumibacter stibioxidans]|uniref:Peptidase C26 n=1 Tax=Flavihumibacter stibioxidans TaxID=1834163 RepID=A0ABR7M5Q8_9BACT|nr:gamma-glutamyl-gamma-aminobutyrate hydrolase family protein [Flavihumibacter stibioxidans]MBC6490354.1 peptidase C26 [Flavihumibacter stibioxidans]